MTFSCQGIGISTAHSVAIGKVHRIQRGIPTIQPRWVGHDELAAEIVRFRNAVSQAQAELTAIRDQLPGSTAPDIIDFINTHLLMLEDQALTQAVEEIIEEQVCAAEWALQQRRNALIQVFDEMDDAYLRTRKDDLDHVVNRIQKRLLYLEEDNLHDNLAGKIIVAQDLTPSDTILMRHRGVIAFVTEYGGPMSHTAILARSLNIPAIVGARHATELLRQGETLVVDGLHGVAIASPETPLLEQFQQRLEQERGRSEMLRELVRIPSLTTDGQAFSLMANIELAEDVETAIANGASAIGLYRTEFLYMNRESLPSENEHFKAYTDILQQLDGMPITIRTLDLGADKHGHYDQSMTCNPALGLRAIRLCLKETELFKTQLRAILRASAFGPVRLMLPMLTSVIEVEQSLHLINEIQNDLRAEGIAFDEQMPIGGMIEVPAAALHAAGFARQLDFLSIGTNDLIQYTLAIDRVDDEVNYLYDPLHPAILKLIQLTIAAAEHQGIPVSMCGEMAGDPRLISLLAGLGLREFSMQPNSLLKAKQALLATHLDRVTRLTSELMDTIDAEDSDSLSEKVAKIIH